MSNQQQFLSDIIKSDTRTVQQIIIDSVNKLADPIVSTLGTNGRNVMFNTYDSVINKPHVTKDGASIAKTLRSENPFENIIMSIAREPAIKTMITSGDGTTTTTLLIRELVIKGYDLLNKGISFYELKKAFMKSLQDIQNEIKSMSIDVEKDMELLHSIASTSANDTKIGDLLIDLIKEISVYGDIDVKESMLFETTIEKTNGLKVYRGYLKPYMINNMYTQSFEAKNCKVVVFEDTLRALNVIFTLVQHINAEPLLIFCEGATELFLSHLEELVSTRGLNICIVENDGFSQRKQMLMEDICIITGAQVMNSNDVLSEEMLNYCIGKTNMVSVTQAHTTLTGDKDDVDGSIANAIEEQVSKIEDILKRDEFKSNTELSGLEKRFYKKRIANFKGGLATILVGGNTQIEIKELKDRIDDAVLAIAASLKSGVCYGGGYTLCNVKKHLLNKSKTVKDVNLDCYTTVINVLSSPLKQLLINSDLINKYDIIENKILKNNGYDLRLNSFVPIINYKVMDATQVLLDSISNAVITAISLLSCKHIVYDGIVYSK